MSIQNPSPCSSQNEVKIRFGPELSWNVGQVHISMEGPHEREAVIQNRR